MKFLEALAQQFAGKPIDWDELEHALIRADLGVALTTRIIGKLQEREAWSLLGIQDVIKVAREEIAKILPNEAKSIQPLSGKPAVVLIVGVNGTGKTTSIAKLAHYLIQNGGTTSVSSQKCGTRQSASLQFNQSLRRRGR
jgi:fused signal recognition particle receptor